MEASRQLELRELIREALNFVIESEGGAYRVQEVRIVPGADFFGLSNGDTLMLPDGRIAVRIAVGRPPERVVDTILHEAAHVILGPEHIENPDHGSGFQALHDRLRRKYAGVVAGRL